MKAVSYRDLLNGSSHHGNSQEALLLTGQRRFSKSRTPSHKDTGNSIWQQHVGRWLRSLKDMVKQRGSWSPACTHPVRGGPVRAGVEQPDQRLDVAGAGGRV